MISNLNIFEFLGFLRFFWIFGIFVEFWDFCAVLAFLVEFENVWNGLLGDN
ncbi:hypothetical protein KFK09_022475 [Dendrobium nobile]|uniref:Uncharacterized protein n=1 Tax=Dendrobium nobile TaxID=94219 RepID=A0A8T3AJ95_DENNO|nr:hypothetical protein KFK09_022475 [Dendrobium nobile]